MGSMSSSQQLPPVPGPVRTTALSGEDVDSPLSATTAPRSALPTSRITGLLELDASMEPADPVLVLPPEMLREVCSYLRPADLARLSELSTGWRHFAGDEALWRNVVLDLGAAAAGPEAVQRWPSPGALRVLRRAPCLAGIHFGGRPIPDKVAELLAEERQVRVRKLLGLRASASALALLRRLGADLEELQLVHPDKEHLEAVSCMGELRALDLDLDISLVERQRVYLRLLQLERGRQPLQLAAQNPALAGLLDQEAQQAVVHAHEVAEEVGLENRAVADVFMLIATKEATEAAELLYDASRPLMDAFREAKAASEDAKMAYRKALAGTEEAQVRVNEAQVRVNEAQVRFNEAQVRVNEAKVLVNEAQVRVNEATVRVNDAQVRVNEAQVRVNEAQVLVNEAQVRVNEAKVRVNEAQVAYKEVQVTYKEAVVTINKAAKEAKESAKETEKTSREAQGALRESQTAYNEAQKASKVAQRASEEDEKAFKEVMSAIDALTGYQDTLIARYQAVKETKVAVDRAHKVVEEAVAHADGAILASMAGRDALRDALEAAQVAVDEVVMHAQVPVGEGQGVVPDLLPEPPAAQPGLLAGLRNVLALHPLGRSLLHHLEEMFDLDLLNPQPQAVLVHGLQAILAGLQTLTVAPLAALLCKHIELPSLPPGLRALRIRSPCLPASFSRDIQGMASLRRLSLTRPSPDSISSIFWDSDRSEEGLPPQLEELEVECVGRAQLESVRGMASLRALTLLGSLPAGVVFAPPPPDHRGLRVLGLDEAACREESALSLLRAHAATLEELHLLLCGPRPDPDLPPHEALLSLTASLRQFLHRRGPSALRRLVLRRQTSCADEAACLAQLQALREDLQAVCIHVACSKCG